jgi:hypothetical protein
MFFSYLLWVPNNKAAINVLPASPEAGNHEGPISPILSNLDEIIQQRKTSYARQFSVYQYFWIVFLFHLLVLSHIIATLMNPVANILHTSPSLLQEHSFIFNYCGGGLKLQR